MTPVIDDASDSAVRLSNSAGSCDSLLTSIRPKREIRDLGKWVVQLRSRCRSSSSMLQLSSGRELSSRTKVCWLGASDRYTFAAQGSKGLTGALALDLFSAISNILSEHRQRLTFPYDIHHALIIRAWSAGHFDDGVFENFDGDSFAIFG